VSERGENIITDKFVFFNVTWMEFYQGPEDLISGGGRYIDDNGYGHEMFNFKEYQGKVYGYVAAKKVKDKGRTMRIQRMGASKDALFIDNITVIWVAPNWENGCTYIIGWYRNARVYRYQQSSVKLVYRKCKDDLCSYNVVAKSTEAILLPVSERMFKIPRGEEHAIGQCNVWYAENNPDFVKEVKDYINGRKPAVVFPLAAIQVREILMEEKEILKTVSPSSSENKMQFTKEFFFNLKNRLMSVKWDPPFDEITAQLLQKDPVSADEFARRTIYVVLASGFKQKTAKIIHNKIMNYITGQIEKSGEQMFSDLIKIFGYENKINAIIKIWENRQKYRNGYYKITVLIEKLQYLQSLPHIGPITRNHLARNLGEDVPKYDIWIQRLGVAFKEQTEPGKGQILKDKINNTKLHSDVKQACDEMFACLVQETGFHICYIDLLLWKACESGLITF
jgi:hypothetical protein